MSRSQIVICVVLVLLVGASIGAFLRLRATEAAVVIPEARPAQVVEAPATPTPAPIAVLPAPAKTAAPDASAMLESTFNAFPATPAPAVTAPVAPPSEPVVVEPPAQPVVVEAPVAPKPAEVAPQAELVEPPKLPAPVEVTPQPKPVEAAQTLTPAEAVPLYVTTSVLNVRSEPSPDGKVVQRVGLGFRLQPVQRSDKWVSFALADGSVGWLSTEFLSTKAPDVPPIPAVRTRPSAEAAPSAEPVPSLEPVPRQLVCTAGGVCRFAE